VWVEIVSIADLSAFGETEFHSLLWIIFVIEGGPWINYHANNQQRQITADIHPHQVRYQ
jgi:hypothetical protein